jgi:agmatinase
MLVDGAHPQIFIEPAAMDVADIGDFATALGDIPASIAMIEAQAREIAHLVAFGGDHTVTLPLLRALHQSPGGPAVRHGPPALVHFDAHVDTWPDNFGQPLGHGSVFYRAIEEGLVEPKRVIQVGIRSPVSRAVHDWTVSRGVTIVTALDAHETGPAAVAARIRDTVGDGPVYLSFDIDVLDPAFAPGTGTPEIGGLATWQVQAILRRLAGLHFIGMDVVEVAPAYDVAEITALAGATVAWEYLCLVGNED